MAIRTRLLLSVVLGLGLAATVFGFRGCPLTTNSGGSPRGSDLDGKSAGTAGGLSDPSEVASPPTLRGHDNPDAVHSGLFGRVVLRDGTRPSEVFVYLLPKGQPGAERLPAMVSPDSRGFWSLGNVTPVNHWIGAVSKGYAPAFVDGDTWAGGEVLLALDRGRGVQVQVRSVKWPLPSDIEIYASPFPWSGFRFPSPESSQTFRRTARPDEAGDATLLVPTHGGVVVSVRSPGFQSEPKEVVLSPLQDRAAFSLLASCSFEVRAFDAETRQDLGMDASVENFRNLAGNIPAFEEEDPGTIDLHHFNERVGRDGLALGRYGLRVACPGYTPLELQNIELTSPGQHAVVDAPMELCRRAGRIDLHFALPTGDSLRGRAIHVRLRRVGKDISSDSDWRWIKPRSADHGESVMRLAPLESGPYEIFAWVGSGLVGHARAKARTEGVQTVSMALGPGLTVDLARGVVSERDVTEAETWVRLRTSSGDRVPVIRFAELQRQCQSTGKPSWVVDGDFFVPSDALLGPYPYEEIIVEVGLEDCPRSWTARRER